MPLATIGEVERKSWGSIWIKLEHADIRDDAVVSESTPGFDLVRDAKTGDRVEVEMEIFPPRTSTLTHLVVNKINRLVPREQSPSTGWPMVR